jgi:hypothetical protein
MIGRRVCFASIAGVAIALAGLTGAAAAADFGDSSYGFEVPSIQGDLAGDQPVLIGHRTRIFQPQVYDPQADYQQGDATYSDQPGIYLQEPLPPRPNGQCLASNQIERMLSRQGWRDFVNPKRGVDVVGLTASRPNGLTYRLKLDRCTGVILQANLLDQPDTRRSYSANRDGLVPGY